MTWASQPLELGRDEMEKKSLVYKSPSTPAHAHVSTAIKAQTTESV